MSKKKKQTLTVAFWVLLVSQFELRFFVDEFVVTFAVVFFALFLYFYEELNPIYTGIITGLTAPGPRAVLPLMNHQSIGEVMGIVLPATLFYVTYGILFYIFYYNSNKKSLLRFIAVAFGCEVISNSVELGLRTNFFTGMSMSMVEGIMILAVIRAIVISSIIVIVKRHNSLLSKEEHEIRYRNLIRQTSIVKSEIYFMNKNMFEIEDVMKRSFTFYKMISEGDYPNEFKNLVLDIAKDVHEIKKVYQRVVKGLEAMSEDNEDNKSMYLKDMVNILEIYTKEYIKEKKLDIDIQFTVGGNFLVKEHFYLMSVLGNLLNNSIEAMEEKKLGVLKLIIYEDNSDIVFMICDNGIGVKESNMEFIFNPGFSTKFDKETGDIWRGLGLTLVKDLVTNIFYGSIAVKSEENRGTEFTIRISCSVLKEVLV